MTVTESETYETGIYQIELTDPVIGGADGIANLQAKQLANRTNFLKAAFGKIVDGTTSIAKALKLATARKISLGGALSGSANFDGSADITITAAVADGALSIAKINGLLTALDEKQDADATLTALAALTIVANKMIYATGTDTFATTTLSAFARTLLDDADAATMRATLGAQEAGSYQDADATLTALAALVTTADKMIYATGADTFATTTLSAFARTLLDDTSAATMRTTLGALGAMSANDANVKTAINATGAAPIYALRAKVTFDGTGTLAILESGNISSVTDNGTGDYTINFATAMPTANYTVSVSVKNTGASGSVVPCATIFSQTTTAVRIRVTGYSTWALSDNESVTVQIA